MVGYNSITSMGNLELPKNFYFFGFGNKSEHSEGIHADSGKTLQFKHQQQEAFKNKSIIL